MPATEIKKREPILETKRLSLFDWTPADRHDLTEILSDVEVVRYIGNGKPFSLNKTIAFIENMRLSTLHHGYARWKVVERSTGKTVGSCGFGLIRETNEVELGYLFGRQFWGRGFAREIATATAVYGFNMLGFREIIALIDSGNTASQNVLIKIGFTNRGIEIFDEEETIVFVKKKSDE